MDLISVLLIEHGIPTNITSFFKQDDADDYLKRLLQEKGVQYNANNFAYIEHSFEIHLMFSKLQTN